MTDPRHQPFAHPAAWRASDFASKNDLAVDLEPRHLAALKDALHRLKQITTDHAAVTPEAFPLAPIEDDVAAWRRDVRDGRGLVLLRGIPVADFCLDDLKLLHLGLGTHFGRPVSQSPLGELVGDVVNLAGDDPRERAYRSSRALRLHTDRCDHIGMLCVRPAAEGGLSGYASALTIHNTILAEQPTLLAPLYRGFFHHRFGQQPPGEPVVTKERIPIFSSAGGVPGVIYIRGYIDLAVEEGWVSLTDEERAALDLMDEISNRPDVRLDLRLEAGEISLTNNCLLLHTRTAFVDAENPALKRHLLRLWLREDGRPMTRGAALHKGNGIARLAGKGTYYTPDAAAHPAH